MIPYLTTRFHRTPYQFLTMMGFQTSDTFMKDRPDFETLRTFIHKQCKQYDAQYIRKCLQILTTGINKPKQMMTVLIFIHLLLQAWQHKSDQLLSLLNQSINQILDKCHDYCENKQKLFFKKYSLTLLTQPDSSQIKRSDQQFVTELQITTGCRGSKINRALSVMAENANQKLNVSPSIQDKKQYQYTSEKQVICQKLVEPYACYLLKKCTSDFEDNTKIPQIMGENIYFWHLANQLKNLFKITENYYIILRYYEHEYLNLILNLTSLLSFEVHQSYPKITQLTKSKLYSTIKQLNTSINPNTVFMSNKQNYINTNETKNKIIQADLEEMKLLLKEVDQINENLINFYMNKYLSDYLKKGFVNMPKMMNLDSIQCEIVYFYIKEEQQRGQKQAKKLRLNRKLSNVDNLNGFFQRASLDIDSNFIGVDPERLTLNNKKSLENLGLNRLNRFNSLSQNVAEQSE